MLPLPPPGRYTGSRTVLVAERAVMSLSAPDRPSSPVPAGRTVAEAVGLGVWLLAAVGWVVWLVHEDWAFGPLHLAAAAGLVLALAILARHGWFRLFGPVLFYEG